MHLEVDSDGKECYTLVDVSTPYHHAFFHKPDQAKILADDLRVKMQREVELQPLIPVGKLKF